MHQNNISYFAKIQIIRLKQIYIYHCETWIIIAFYDSSILYADYLLILN